MTPAGGPHGAGGEVGVVVFGVVEGDVGFGDVLGAGAGELGPVGGECGDGGGY